MVSYIYWAYTCFAVHHYAQQAQSHETASHFMNGLSSAHLYVSQLSKEHLQQLSSPSLSCCARLSCVVSHPRPSCYQRIKKQHCYPPIWGLNALKIKKQHIKGSKSNVANPPIWGLNALKIKKQCCYPTHMGSQCIVLTSML